MSNIPEHNQRWMEELGRQAAQTHNNNNPVIAVYTALCDYIRGFEEILDDTQEVGARLVSFGNTVTFHVRNIDYSQPSVITFDGVTDEGNKVRLVQHVTQLSVLLIALPVRAGEQKRPIGFVTD
jgi:hypothetical protein